MKAMILAAGLGTRLKPWTLNHPKALVPVEGVPMLERVIQNLKMHGFDRIVVNVHHFADQIYEFLRQRDFGVRIAVSDETSCLLDTGGAILHARDFLFSTPDPVLVHNVDILSNADLGVLMAHHEIAHADSTLLVSGRESSRKLVFSPEMRLRGWHNMSGGEFKPEGFRPVEGDMEYAFSGIHVLGKSVVEDMANTVGDKKFSIIDYLLGAGERMNVVGFKQENLQLLDIGKPATLSQASGLLSSL